eukprot:445088_1
MCNDEYINHLWCKMYFPEWYLESTWYWLAVKFILMLIAAAMLCAITILENTGHTIDYAGPKIFEPIKALMVVIFMIFVGFLTMVYATWQHKIAPWWFKLLSLVLYFGTLAFFFWEFHIAKDGGILPDIAQLNTNKQPFDLWTINHFFAGVLFGVMFPFWWMVIVVIAWEAIEILIYGAGDEDLANAGVDIIVAIIGWWIVILIFAKKCIPWISSRCAVEQKQQTLTEQINVNNMEKTIDEHDDDPHMEL